MAKVKKGKVLKSLNWSSRKVISETRFFEALPFIFFLTFVGVLYISFSYRLERTQKSINSLKGDLEELRTEYIETQTEINTKSIQSEIVKKVKPYGLQEIRKSPKVIVQR